MGPGRRPTSPQYSPDLHRGLISNLDGADRSLVYGFREMPAKTNKRPTDTCRCRRNMCPEMCGLHAERREKTCHPLRDKHDLQRAGTGCEPAVTSDGIICRPAVYCRIRKSCLLCKLQLYFTDYYLTCQLVLLIIFYDQTLKTRDPANAGSPWLPVIRRAVHPCRRHHRAE